MNYTDAELNELGIERTTAPGRGRQETDAYIIKCYRCGRPVLRRSIILSKPTYCNLCRSNALSKRKIAERIVKRDAEKLGKLMGIDPKLEERFFKASTIANKVGNYQKAVRAASAYSTKYGSVPEALAAILLISCGIKVIPQAKIFKDNRSAVDFILPEHKVAVEIDGELYHKDETKQEIRDISIKRRLGEEWDVLHIPAEAITKKPESFRKLILKRFCSNEKTLHR